MGQGIRFRLHGLRVDSNPAHGEVPGTAVARIRSEDAHPDHMEVKGDVAGGCVDLPETMVRLDR